MLVIGTDIPRLRCVAWDEWRNHNLLDYQGLLIDCRAPSRLGTGQQIANVLAEFMRHGHKVFLILPKASDLPAGVLDLSVLPYARLHLQVQKGKTLRIALQSALFETYSRALQGHETITTFQQTVTNMPNGWHWQIAVADNVNRAVCGQFADAYVLHAPAPGREELAIRAILDFFKPDFEEPEPQEPPEWSEGMRARIPGIADARANIEQATQRIAELESELERSGVKLRDLEQWAEMLWLDGIPLQTRVSEALQFLGMPNHSKDPTGHTQDLQGTFPGHPMLFEVTGSKGGISVDKGRQLLQWMGECEDPTNTKGVLIGNAYREHPPDKRPPDADHKIFVKELEDMAVKFHFALVETRDVFELVCRKLGGARIDPEDLCKRLQEDGVVKFAKDEKQGKDAVA